MSHPAAEGEPPPIVQYWDTEEVPAYLDPVLESIKRHNPDSQYLIFNESTATEFIAEHLGPREVEAFRSCAVPAMQSDYFRYCALYVLGGVYSDLDFTCTGPFRPLLNDPYAQLFRRPLGMVMNGFFAFPSPRHLFLRLTIDVVTANIESRELEKITGVTGPLVLSGLAMLHELGSIDAFLHVGRDGGGIWQPRVIAEVVGDYERIAEAFEDVRLDSIARLKGFISNRDIAHAKDKQWGRWESSIYRSAAPVKESTASAAKPERGARAVEERRSRSGVVVLGAARSGTSAVTGAFVAAGFFAGPKENLLGPSLSNPAGHFELQPVVELNQEIIERSGGSWWADAPAADAQRWYRDRVEPRLEAVLAPLIEAADGAPVALKDPRINLLLPLWQEIVDDTLHPVLTVRDPLQIALSHASRDGISMSHALAAWEAQMTMALQSLEGWTVTVAPYAELISKPELAADLVREAASHLDPALAGGLRPAEAASAWRPDLQRERSDDLAHADYLTWRQTVLWNYLRGLDFGAARLSVPLQLRGASSAARAAVKEEGERIRIIKALKSAAAETTAQTEALEKRFDDAISLARKAVAAATEHADQAKQMAAEAKERLGQVNPETPDTTREAAGSDPTSPPERDRRPPGPRSRP